MSSYFFGRLNNGIVNSSGSEVKATNIGKYYNGLKKDDVVFIRLASENAIDVIGRVRSRLPAGGGGGKEEVVFDILADLRGKGFSIDHFTRLVFFYLNNEYLLCTKRPSKKPFPKLQVVHGQDENLESFLAAPKGEIERRLRNYPREDIFRKLIYSPAMQSNVGNDFVFCPDPKAKCGYRYVDTNFMPKFGDQSDDGIDRALNGDTASFCRKFKRWLEASEKTGSSVEALEPTFSALRDVLWNGGTGPHSKKKRKACSNESETNAVSPEASARGEEGITGTPDAAVSSLGGLYQSNLPIPLPVYNKVYYGIPGCGKSHKIKNETNGQIVIRTTFYEDYSYSDFIGQYRPGAGGYCFNPGPFAKALLLAFREIKTRSSRAVYLVIEEINRGNAPSIFGDTFQLLDRDADGTSEYPIENADLIAYLGKELDLAVDSVFIPANLVILGTMNTADQNVFTLDTAFKRRFEWEEVFDDWDTCDYRDWLVPGSKSKETWKTFVDKINAKIIGLRQNSGLSGDMRIASHFLGKACLIDKDAAFNSGDPAHMAKAVRFAAKIIEYLYDDVAKWDRESLFNEDIKTLSEANRKFREACEKGDDSLKAVFHDVF